MTRPSKSAKEIEIFRKFAAVSGLDIDMSSVEGRAPPEPDILCRSTEGKDIAFELTELIDQSHMERMAMVLNTKSALERYFREALTQFDHDKFALLYVQLQIENELPLR